MHVSSALKGDDGYGDCRRDNRSDRRFGDCAGGECVEAQTDAGGRSFAAKQRDGDRRGGGAIPRDSAQQDGVGGGRPERRPYGIRRIRSEAAPPVSARVRNVRARDDRYLRHLASVEGRKPRGCPGAVHGTPRCGRGRPDGLDARSVRGRHRGRQDLCARCGGHQMHLGCAHGGGRKPDCRRLHASARRVLLLIEHRGRRRRYRSSYG